MTSTSLMGGCTRASSQHFDAKVDGRITAIRAWGGGYVDAVQFQIDGSRWTPKIGGPGGTLSSFTLSSAEHISKVDIRCGGVVDSIKFTTSTGRTFASGGPGGGRADGATFTGRIDKITGTADYWGPYLVLQNISFRYTAGNFRTRAEEKEAEESLRRQREADRREADRKAAEKVAQETRKRLRSQITQTEGNIKDVQREKDALAPGANERLAKQQDLQQRIALERAQLGKLSQERIPADMKVIVLLGMTGDGKSTLGNRLCGDISEEGNSVNSPFCASRRGHSETAEIQNSASQSFGQNLCIVDTPGWDDSADREREHCNKLIHYLRGCGGVNQFFLVKMCSNPRLSGKFRSMLARFEELVGHEFWQYVTVVLTAVEGRHVGRMDDYQRDMVEAISQAHGCPPVNVIGVGFDDGYQQTIQRLVDEVPAKKFQPSVLTSPVEELEREIQTVNDAVRMDKNQQDKLTRRLNALQTQRNNLQRELQAV